MALGAQPTAPVEPGLGSRQADVADDRVVGVTGDGVTGVDGVADHVDSPAFLASPRLSSPAIRTSSSTTSSFTCEPSCPED